MVSLAGGLQTKSMTSYRAEPSKMAGMRYHGNVMTTTRWRLYIKKQQHAQYTHPTTKVQSERVIDYSTSSTVQS